MNKKDVGKKIKLLTIEKDISAKELAYKLGVGVSSVYMWFRGETLPSGSRLYKLAEFFDISPEELLPRDDETESRLNPGEIDILEEIGIPAMFEQLAEECTELAQVALKAARKLRGENPTPKTLAEINHNFIEEISDVCCCMNFLMTDGEWDMAEAIHAQKIVRWETRIYNARKEAENEQSRTEE